LDKSNNNIDVSEKINQDIKAPVKKGDVLGYLEYKRNGVLLGKVNLIASQDIEKDQKAVIKGKTKNIINISPVRKIILVIIIIVPLFLLTRVVLRTISLKIRERDRFRV
jgi:D-alanyl-D-alanine carboxypeptidase/D-alanyl-D-alanine carboxypeptidase (penicillin-binding protein 5/6)